MSGPHSATPRILFSLLVLVANTTAARAAEPDRATIRLTVRPCAAPKPALKYRLLPEVSELAPGNAAQWYLRCFAEQRRFFFSKEGRDERTQLLTLPLSEIRVGDYGGNALRQADYAARLDTIDWQILQRVQADGVGLSQPEIEPLRILAQGLRARFRVELAAENYDNAIRTAKTLLAFARHLGESPTEKANRLGLDVAEMALDSLEEMIQQPRAPNLYWALSDLPAPLVDLRKGLQATVSAIGAELNTVREDTVMTDEQIEKVVSHLSGILSVAREEAGHAPRSFRGVLKERIKDPANLRSRRDRLIKEGLAEGLVPSFPALQVVLIEEKRLYENRRDDRLKLLPFAPWQIEAMTSGQLASGDGLLADLLPPVLDHRLKQARFEQRVGALRLVEAVRMYAAEHGGALPASTGELGVPEPIDPFTGKSFGYEARGATAGIRVGSFKGVAPGPTYELVVRP